MGIHTWYDPYTSGLKCLNIFTKSLLPPINNIGQTAEQMTVAKTQQEHKDENLATSGTDRTFNSFVVNSKRTTIGSRDH